MADSKLSGLTELATEPASTDQFYISDVSEAADADKSKYIQAGTFLPGRTLANLSTTAINTSLISDTDSTDSLGSTAKKWLSAFVDKILFDEGAAPSTPDSGDVVAYAKTDGKLYSKDDAGNEHALTQVTGNISASAAAMWPSSTNGCAYLVKKEYATNDVDLQVLAFDKDTDEFAQFSLVMPDDWDAGTITAQFFWSVASGDGGAAETVCWGIQGRSYANDAAIDQAWGTVKTVTDTWIADDDIHITSATAAVTLAGTPAAGEFCQFRVQRDISDDDMGGDALLIAVKITFTRV